MSFEIIGLSEALLAAVADAGYSEPTPIQRQAIPSVLQGRDVLGIAQTGTGKTASFTLPMIDILAEGRARARMPRSLILEPTRELAAQVAENFDKYGVNHKLSKALLIGGVSFADQEKALDRGVDVLIATPGRLLDHFERGKLMLSNVQILVVDEADRMLDMGFIPDVEKICKLMPQKHQSLFFSATMPPPVKRLTDQFLVDPKMIEVAPPATTSATVEQSLLIVSSRNKGRALRKLLERETIANGIIFCNRKRDVKSVFTSLTKYGFSVGQLHGDMAQSERMEMLQRFKDNEVALLVASDVAARGLDIAAVSHVFNYDVPTSSDDYVHRIGRTGRAGREGSAFTIATPDDQKYVEGIEKLTKNALPRHEVEGVTALAFDDGEATTDEKPRRRRSKKSDPGEKSAAPKERAEKAAPSREAKPRGRRERSRDREDRDRPVIGMGDHVPAFLLRGLPDPTPATAEQTAND